MPLPAPFRRLAGPAVLAGLLAVAPAAGQTYEALAFAAPYAAHVNFPACMDAHFDGARYRADLIAQGWSPVRDEAEMRRGISLLVETFLNYTHPGEDGDLAARRDAALNHWRALTGDGDALLIRPGEALYLVGDTGGRGHRRVRCFVVTQAAQNVDTFIAAIYRENGLDEAPPEAAVSRERSDYADDSAFEIGVIRRLSDLTEPPSVLRGMLTSLILPPSD